MVGGNSSDRELGAFTDVDATDADDFIERLDRMRAPEGVTRYKRESFEAMRIAPGAKVADIGCGAGDDVARLAEMVGADGLAYGIDLSTAMIAEASARFGALGNAEFIAAGLEALPLATASLDAVRIDRVLIHVPDPAAALNEVLRVLRPGGRLVLCEPDLNGLWVSSEDREAAAVITAVIAGSCVNSYIPRDMAVMLKDLSLQDVVCSATAMISDDFDMIDRVVQFELASQAAATIKPDMAERITAWLPDQRRRKEYDRFCAGMNIITASATKP